MADEKPQPRQAAQRTTCPPPKAAGDKPPSDAPAEPLKGEVSRVDPRRWRRSRASCSSAQAPDPRRRRHRRPTALRSAAAPAAPPLRRRRASPAPPCRPDGSADRPPAPQVPAFIEALQAAFPGAIDAGQLLGRRLDGHRAGDRLLDVARPPPRHARCAVRLSARTSRRQRLAAAGAAVRRRVLPVFDARTASGSREGAGGGRRTRSVGQRASGPRPTGWSARSTTCSA